MTALLEHRPLGWFTRRAHPSCSCGFAPNDNALLINHWHEHGIDYIDVNGTILARPWPVAS